MDDMAYLRNKLLEVKIMNEKTCIAKVIKAYVLLNPGCTAKRISEWINENNFGLRDGYSSDQVSYIIRNYNESRRFQWFNIKSKKKNHKLEYYIG